MALPAPAVRGWRLAVPIIGIAQILSWGSSYYLLAVFAQPISSDTGWPLPWVVGGGSLGLLFSGLAAPFVGRMIHQFGGRVTMAVGSLLIGGGLAVVASAPNLPIYFLGWAVLGAGMGAGLYDAAFSTLGRIFGTSARRAISNVTLFGGFASTVCWPVSAFVVEAWGWRAGCLVYAVAHALVMAPVLLTLLPREAEAPPRRLSGDDSVPWTKQERRAFLLLAAILMLAGVAQTTIAVHLLTILQSQGMALAGTVVIGALIGPSQVGARIVERLVGERLHPLQTLFAAAVLMAAGLLLLATDALPAAVAVVFYAAGNGVWSIARGTVPLSLFGSARYPVVMGRLAAPNLIVQSLAPFAAGLLLATTGPATVLALIAGLTAVNASLVLVLGRLGRGR